ncbi:MAG: hypothetical protein EOQ89_26345 [Mesorhizobium sp.]|nr:MAG: hypothetical protein EOQ89_26345 [Mesorhizobium sp.]
MRPACGSKEATPTTGCFAAPKRLFIKRRQRAAPPWSGPWWTAIGPSSGVPIAMRRNKEHANAHQTCVAHLARDVAHADEASEDMLPSRLKRWLQAAFALADGVETFAASTIAGKRRALERSLNDILATTTSCDLARDIQNKFRRARNQLLTFAQWPGMVGATNNACERALRPAVVQRKITNGYRAMWAAHGDADIRTVVDTARLAPGTTPSKSSFKPSAPENPP